MADSDVTDAPLSVAVVGDVVRVLLPDGTDMAMTARAAERSAQRLLDAVALATGRHPKSLKT